MTNTTTAYQPLDEYKAKYKDNHSKNVSDFFDDCIVQAKTNEQENKKTVANINLHQKSIEKLSSSFKKKKKQRGFLVFLTVVAFGIVIAFGVNIFCDLFESQIKTTLFSTSTGAFLSVISILLIKRKLNPAINMLDEQLKKMKSELDALIKEAWTQVASLVGMFNHYTSARLFEKTYPFISLDDNFDIKRYDFLSRKFGMWDNNDKDVSTLFVQSGEINGNPFCFFKTLNHFMSRKTYHGSKTIYWAETYIDSKGKRQTRQCSQTIHAKVTKPFPDYYNNTYLVYGNEAAPNLVFSRKMSKANTMNNSKLNKYIKNECKNLESSMRKKISKGENFTMMSNSEFEVLFGAANRNNEVEFRLLFTPIAQREILNLIKDKTVAWGDNFDFTKQKMLNLVFPSHLQTIDISGDINNYIHYDVDTMKRNFNNYNNLYFKSIYFAFAPLLAIPLYCQHKTHEFIYKDVYPQHYSCFEHEFFVNRMEKINFVHNASVTNNILKTKHLSCYNQTDRVLVTAHGFRSEERTDYVNVRGGDGGYHSVPVNWTEYLAVSKDTETDITI
jgi:hypothetical protein